LGLGLEQHSLQKQQQQQQQGVDSRRVELPLTSCAGAVDVNLQVQVCMHLPANSAMQHNMPGKKARHFLHM
jgi:hypothetical protein